MHRRIDKKKNKLYLYIFLFFLLSTTNNISLSNSKILSLKINQIKVFGLTNENNLEIIRNLNQILFKNILFLNQEFIRKIIEQNNSIHSFEIKKIYPDSIEINIKKTKFLAIRNFDQKKFFIGSNAKLIEFDYSTKNLPYVFGNVEAEKFIKFKEIISQSSFDFNEITDLYFFPSGRWDIKINNGTIFKFPEKNLLETLEFAHKIINNEDLKNKKIIDLRISNNLILLND
jgi:cell division protein FtsQ